MGADFPDWGGQYNSSLFYPLFDMSELAVRLGSRLDFDRRGSLIWLESFDFGLDYVTQSLGSTGGAVSLLTSPALHPPFACQLDSGSAQNDTTSISVKLPFVQSGKVGLAAWLQTAASTADFTLRLQYEDGSRRRYGEIIQRNLPSQDIRVTNGDSYAEIQSGSSVAVFNTSFVFVKLVLDVSMHKMERANINGAEYDLSAYDVKNIGASTEYQITPLISIKAVNAANKVAYVDTIALTAAEPAN